MLLQRMAMKHGLRLSPGLHSSQSFSASIFWNKTKSLMFFEFGDDLDSTGKLRLQTASRDSGYPAIIQCTIGANNNYALAA